MNELDKELKIKRIKFLVFDIVVIATILYFTFNPLVAINLYNKFIAIIMI
jgi:hypothetical protein